MRTVLGGDDHLQGRHGRLGAHGSHGVAALELGHGVDAAGRKRRIARRDVHLPQSEINNQPQLRLFNLCSMFKSVWCGRLSAYAAPMCHAVDCVVHRLN